MRKNNIILREKEFSEAEKLRVYLMMIAVGGFLGAYTFTLKGGVFCNAQTGNFVFLAIAIARQGKLSPRALLLHTDFGVSPRRGAFGISSEICEFGRICTLGDVLYRNRGAVPAHPRIHPGQRARADISGDGQFHRVDAVQHVSRSSARSDGDHLLHQSSPSGGGKHRRNRAPRPRGEKAPRHAYSHDPFVCRGRDRVGISVRSPRRTGDMGCGRSSDYRVRRSSR